jgi:hypothetical protein
MTFKHRLKSSTLAVVTLIKFVRAQSSSSAIQSLVPQCAQQCLEQSILQTFSQACPDITNFTCLCTHYGSDGYSLGEKALSCIYSNICGQDALQSTTASYDICNQVSNAVTPTHSSVAGSILGGVGNQSTLPSISLPTTTGGTVKSATSEPVNQQNSSKKLDTTQVAAVVIASIALLVVVVTAVALILLRTRSQSRSRRRPADVDEIKAMYSISHHKGSSRSRTTPGGYSSNSPESQKSRGSSSAQNSDGTTRTWPKYYRISPPSNVGLAPLQSQSTSTLRSSRSTEAGLRRSKPEISIKQSPSTERRTVRVSGFMSPPPESERPTVPERSPYRTNSSTSISIQIPEASNRTPPMQVYSSSRPGLDSHSVTFVGLEGKRNRNLVTEISNAASAGTNSISAYSLHGEGKDDPNLSSRHHGKSRSEASSTYGAVDSSPSANRPRRPRGESSGKRSSKKKQRSSSRKNGGHHSSGSSDRSGSAAETGNKKESRQLSPLSESYSSGHQSTAVTQGQAANLATRSSQSSLNRSVNNSTPANVTVIRHTQSLNGRSSSTHRSSSTTRKSNAGPHSTTSSQYSRSTNEQLRYATNSAPIAGLVQTPERTYAPGYHYSRELEQQAAMLLRTPVSGPVAGEPRHDGTYGFF